MAQEIQGVDTICTNSDLYKKDIILSVKTISQLLKHLIEDSLSRIKVRGEVSGVKKSSLGHIYFVLKDETAVLNIVCWANVASTLDIVPEDGMEVVCSGHISTYPGKSYYQLIMQNIVISGVGQLLALLEKRKQQLEAEGLFAPERKKPIPFLPKIIGIITSAQGAVISDILHRISERFPVHVIVWNVAVQGNDSASQVSNAINGFNQLHPHIYRPDLLIIARGGGSIEDLWPFNAEVVVRSIVASKIPLISAIGHETDWTLADLAADYRAPTPTAAAEIAVPVRLELLKCIQISNTRLQNNVFFYISNIEAKLRHAYLLLVSIRKKLDNYYVTILRLYSAFTSAFIGCIQYTSNILVAVQHRFSLKHICNIIHNKKIVLNDLQNRLGCILTSLMSNYNNILLQYMHLLQQHDQRRILKQGYAIVNDQNGQCATSSKQLITGQRVKILFHDGGVFARILH